MSNTTAPIKLHEQRFMVSPCGKKAEHVHVDEIEVRAPGWTDCTRMGDAAVQSLMVRRMMVSKEAA